MGAGLGYGMIGRPRAQPATSRNGVTAMTATRPLPTIESMQTDYPRLLREALGDAGGDPGRIGMVVVSYGSHRMLAANLHPELTRQLNARIVVVDNLSTADERAALRQLAGERGWSLVEAPANEGFGIGVNRGVLRAAELGCGIFVTVNPDAVITSDVLAELGRSVTERPRELVGPRLENSAGANTYRGSMIDVGTGRMRSGWIASDDDPRWKNWLSGACLAFAGEAFAELGGFGGDYFLYWEDVDLSRRAAAAGMGLVIRNDLVATHDEGGTHNQDGSRAKSALYYYYNTRNRLLFASRIVPRGQWRSWVLATPAESYRIWLRGGRRQLFTRPMGLLAAVRGTLAGLWYLRPGTHVDGSPSSRASA